MMSALSVAQVCKKLQEAKTKSERVDILKHNDSAALRGILRMNYDSSLVLALPEGTPPYNSSHRPEGLGDTTLKSSVRGWYVFVKDAAPNIRQSKRESLFIALLESLDSKEAEIILKAKDRKLELGLTKKVIDEVFPGLIKSEGKNHGKKDQPTKTTDSAASSHTSDG